MCCSVCPPQLKGARHFLLFLTSLSSRHSLSIRTHARAYIKKRRVNYCFHPCGLSKITISIH
ncbi:hypothetical protein Hanom_Chr13g01242141 [Helianthus anomalus]